MEDFEGLDLGLAVDEQLRALAVNPEEDHVVRGVREVAAHQEVGDACCEVLKAKEYMFIFNNIYLMMQSHIFISSYISIGHMVI